MALSSLSHYHHHHCRKKNDDTGFGFSQRKMKSIRGGACASSGFEKQREQRQKKKKFGTPLPMLCAWSKDDALDYR